MTDTATAAGCTLIIHETGTRFADVFRYLFGDAAHVYGDLRKVAL